jgi:SAM-dependent methyltransferase
VNWRVKGLIQKALGGIPGGVRVNDLMQRTFGELRNVEATIDSKVVDDWSVLAGILAELGIPTSGTAMVEVGTGWFPVFPLCFALAGARTCDTYDLSRHLSAELTRRAVERISRHLRQIADITGLSVNEVEQRYARLSAAEEPEPLLRAAGVSYHAPADASRTGLPSGSIDVVYSNSVLEHVHPDAIRGLFLEAARILRPNGVAIHSVNCGDHYAYFDRSITPINYLKYSQREWRRWDNGMLYQNRLRPIDFLNLARNSGLEIVTAVYKAKPQLLSALPTFELATEFRSYPAEELCATSIDFVARPMR